MNRHQTAWMHKVCKALNDADLPFKDGGSWEASKFTNIYELIRYHVTYDVGIYNYLNSSGVINDGHCPITGDRTTGQYAYQFFGRGIVMTREGLKIAKQEDPDHDEELQKKIREAKKQLRKQHSGGGCLGVLLIIVALLCAISCRI